MLGEPGLTVDSVSQGVFDGSTSLGDVYQGLVGGGLDESVAEFLADQTSQPGSWALPGISHADGYEAYQVTTCNSSAYVSITRISSIPPVMLMGMRHTR